VIATVLAVPQSTVTMVRSAGWNPDAPATGSDHLPESNVANVGTAQIPAPTRNTVPREGFPGLRAVVAQLTRLGIPKVPGGPPKISRMGQGYVRAGRQPKRVNKVQQYVPAPTVEQAGDWFSYLDSVR
jgi:hypothetical protein